MSLLAYTYFSKPQLLPEVIQHLPVVDDPGRPSGVFFNVDALQQLKEASRDRCFYIMIDVIFFKLPVEAHMVYILATTEDGSLNKVLYMKLKHRQFDSKEVLDTFQYVHERVRQEGLERHLVAIVADEATNNALLREAGYPVVIDLRHLQQRMDTLMGHNGGILRAVYKHAVFRSHNFKEKFATIRTRVELYPTCVKTRILAELEALERVVVRRFAVLDTPFHLREANSDTLESSGRKIATVAASIMVEALKKDPLLKSRLLDCHRLLRRVVCLLCMLEKMDIDLSGLQD